MPTIYSDVENIKNLPDRKPFDFYKTDIRVCRQALENLPAIKFNNIMDAGAGTGVWGIAARERFPLAQITGIELRETPAPMNEDGRSSYNHWYSAKSYLHAYGKNDNIKAKEAADLPPLFGANSFDLVIGNPPYNIAEDFVIYSMENVLGDTGYICMLLQATFLWGERRLKRVHTKYPPKDVIIRKRVSFTEDGKTNADDYAYYIWEKGYTGKPQISWDIRK